MSSVRTRRVVVASALLAAALWVGVVSAGEGGGASPAQDSGSFSATFESVVALVRSNYWDPLHLDWDAWAERFRADAVVSADRGAFDVVMARMLRALDDGHSRWVGLTEPAPPTAPLVPSPPRIGCACVYLDGRGLLVERVYPDTPAASAGLLRGDVVVSVDDVALGAAGSLVAANGLLRQALERGPVTLQVERRRRSLEIVVEAAEVAFATVAALPYARMLDASNGYLAIPTFLNADVATAAHAALAQLQAAGAVGLVLDLRGNAGGRLLEAGGLMAAVHQGTWALGVARGEVVWRAATLCQGGEAVSCLVAADGTLLAAASLDARVAWDGPLVVLVDAATTSVAEVVAAALQRSGRARVVGEPTPGNVEAVQGFTLADGSRVLVAVADLRAADGASLAAGVVPDVVARADRDALALGLDLPVAVARQLLGGLPFTPDTRF